MKGSRSARRTRGRQAHEEQAQAQIQAQAQHAAAMLLAEQVLAAQVAADRKARKRQAEKARRQFTAGSFFLDQRKSPSGSSGGASAEGERALAEAAEAAADLEAWERELLYISPRSMHNFDTAQPTPPYSPVRDAGLDYVSEEEDEEVEGQRAPARTSPATWNPRSNPKG